MTKMSETDARAALFPASNAGVVWVGDDSVRFRHDKQRTASAALIPEKRKASIHHHIAQWMLKAGLTDENIFDSASPLCSACSCSLLSRPCRSAFLSCRLLRRRSLARLCYRGRARPGPARAEGGCTGQPSGRVPAVARVPALCRRARQPDRGVLAAFCPVVGRGLRD
jgi:hypothetical protein